MEKKKRKSLKNVSFNFTFDHRQNYKQSSKAVCMMGGGNMPRASGATRLHYLITVLFGKLRATTTHSSYQKTNCIFLQPLIRQRYC